MTDVNAPLAVGDPVVAQTQTLNGPLPGPFAGQAINCRSCHFVVEFQGVTGAGNRTYADFTTRSPIPRPMNGFTFTPRNSMQMVGSLQPHSGPQFLHFDGEFADPADLVKKTITGRNFGWGPTEYQAAIAHIADVIRNDNGKNDPANEFGCGFTYKAIFLGTDPTIPADCKMPPQYRLDVSTRHRRADRRRHLANRRAVRRSACASSRTKSAATSARPTTSSCASIICRRNREPVKQITNTPSACSDLLDGLSNPTFG